MEIAEETGDAYARGTIHNNGVHLHCRQRRFEEAIAQAKIAVVEWSGSLYVEGTSHETLARAYMHAGRLAEAADTFQVALTLLRETGYRIGHAVAAWWYGQTLHEPERPAKARRIWQDCCTTPLEARLLTRAEVDELLDQPVPEMPGPIGNML
ncbi:tetratricopeptide repeat protein [Nonomuraea sp. KM90]|uniref:tetratricopeptide repeat protein n=1 Tax=Nonomuraea sp. KM90 TaxID=3457428 RepID=UPI003FCEE4EF